jgi:hypothetical protein
MDGVVRPKRAAPVKRREQGVRMSARRTILRELSARHEKDGGNYTRPDTITGFTQNRERFQAAVNELLQERLINGTKDAEGRLAIALNAHRLADVRKELRPWYARPFAWMGAGAAGTAVIAAIGLLF